jgi:hypothetical protein
MQIGARFEFLYVQRNVSNQYEKSENLEYAKREQLVIQFGITKQNQQFLLIIK